MKGSSSQNYSYAVDKEDNIIHVSSAIRGAEYFCPCCHALMTPHMGKIRRWHFTHKANINNCTYETYLHKIAKFKIRKAFLSASKFVISYDVPAVCMNRDSCRINKGQRCVGEDFIEHDIKQFYDSCEEEVPYKSFIADLFISSSSKPEREPILIEIYVSHKSTIEKIEAGVRIIEVQIRNEEDIDEIVSSLRIDGIQKSDRSCFGNEKQKNIFFNFKGQVLKRPAYFNGWMPNYFHYLWMNKNGYFKAGRCPCDDDPMRHIPTDVHYVISSESFSWKWAFLEFVKRGVDVKNCFVCKYSTMTSMSIFEERICTLYKKFGTPRHPNVNTAKTCSYFRLAPHAEKNDLFISPSNVMGGSEIETEYTIVGCK